MIKCDAVKGRECIWIRLKDKHRFCVQCPIWDPEWDAGRSPDELAKALRPLAEKGGGQAAAGKADRRIAKAERDLDDLLGQPRGTTTRIRKARAKKGGR